MPRKTRAADVAAAAGVSPATVDRVLNDRGGVSAAKERLVLHWAGRLGLDRNLRRRPTRMVRVAALMQRPSNPFFQSLRRGFLKANALYAALNLQVTLHYWDATAAREGADLLRAVAATSDAVVVVAPGQPAILSAIREIAACKPLLTMVSDLPDSGRLAYVGPDNAAAGRVAGTLIGRFLGPAGGSVAVVLGLHSYVGHGERAAGFRAVLAERFPQCRLIDVLETGERSERAYTLFEQMVARVPELVAVYNISAANAGVAQVLQERGLAGRVVLIEHELTDSHRDLLRAGVIDAVIDQNPDQEAMAAIDWLAHHFGRQEHPPSHTLIPFTIHLSDNC